MSAHGGWVADPGAGGAIAPVIPEHDTDLIQDARNGRVRRPWDTRNGLPEPKPYVHREGEAARDEQIAAQVAEARRRAEAKKAREDEEVRLMRAAGSTDN